MFPACIITTEVKFFAGVFQRICQDFKTRKQEILSTYFIERIDLSFTSPVKLLPLSLKWLFFLWNNQGGYAISSRVN